jgi:hypothetical protein
VKLLHPLEEGAEMKISQLQNILEAAAIIYRDAGNSAASQCLTQFSDLFVSHDAKTVASFSKALAKALSEGLEKLSFVSK